MRLRKKWWPNIEDDQGFLLEYIGIYCINRLGSHISIHPASRGITQEGRPASGSCYYLVHGERLMFVSRYCIGGRKDEEEDMIRRVLIGITQ